MTNKSNLFFGRKYELCRPKLQKFQPKHELKSFKNPNNKTQAWTKGHLVSTWASANLPEPIGITLNLQVLIAVVKIAWVTLMALPNL